MVRFGRYPTRNTRFGMVAIFGAILVGRYVIEQCKVKNPKINTFKNYRNVLIVYFEVYIFLTIRV